MNGSRVSKLQILQLPNLVPASGRIFFHSIILKSAGVSAMDVEVCVPTLYVQTHKYLISNMGALPQPFCGGERELLSRQAG